MDTNNPSPASLKALPLKLLLQQQKEIQNDKVLKSQLNKNCPTITNYLQQQQITFNNNKELLKNNILTKNTTEYSQQLKNLNKTLSTSSAPLARITSPSASESNNSPPSSPSPSITMLKKTTTVYVFCLNIYLKIKNLI